MYHVWQSNMNQKLKSRTRYVAIKGLHDRLSVLCFWLDHSLESFTFCHRHDKFLRNAIRYYHHIPEHDIHEALSEEDLYASQMLKNPPRKPSAGYYQNWISQRNSTDRYDTNEQPSRRARTRPEVKSFMEAEFIDRRKCSRCGNISSRKPSASRRDAYRYQNNPNFSTKAHFGKRIAKLFRYRQS